MGNGQSIPNKAALILCDYQPGVLSVVLGEDEARRKSILENAKKALDAARSNGVDVAHVRVCVPSIHTRNSRKNKFFSGAIDRQILQEGTAQAKIVDLLEPTPEEPIFTKSRFSAFSTTLLEGWLRNRGIDTIFLAGLSTSGVILSTIRDAGDKDFIISVLEDACADGNEDVHRTLFDHVFPTQATVITTEQFCKAVYKPPEQLAAEAAEAAQKAEAEEGEEAMADQAPAKDDEPEQ